MLLVVLFFLGFLCHDVSFGIFHQVLAFGEENRYVGVFKVEVVPAFVTGGVSCSSMSIGSTARCSNISIKGGYLLEAWRDVLYANTQASRYVLHCVFLLDTYFTKIFCRNRSCQPVTILTDLVPFPSMALYSPALVDNIICIIRCGQTNNNYCL